MDSCACTRLMALAKRGATLRTLILEWGALNGTESETTISVSAEFSMVSKAFPENIPWVQKALTLRAPFSMMI